MRRLRDEKLSSPLAQFSGSNQAQVSGKNWRRERDSNPRWAFDPYTLSRGAPSTTRPSLRRAQMIRTGRRAGKETGVTRSDGCGCGSRRGVLAVLGRLALLVPDALVDLFAVDAHFLRGEHADADLVSLDAEHRDRDVVTDHQRLADATRQYQHAGIPPHPRRFLMNA